MKRILPVLFSIIIANAFGQISITMTNMPVSGDTCRVSNASLASLTSTNNTSYTVTGTNFTWKFDSLKATSQDLRDFKTSAAAGYLFYTGYGEKTIDTLNLGIVEFTNVYNFYKNLVSSFSIDALGLTYMGFGIPNVYSDKDELYTFPLNYGDRDSTTFKFSTITSSLVPLTYKKQGYRITQADGWGTVTTPFGTQQCLRVVTTQYSLDTIKGSVPIGTFTIPLNIGFPNNVRSYQWLTLTEKIPFLEVSGNFAATNFVPTAVKFRDNLKYFVGIQEPSKPLALPVYPNPSTGELNIVSPRGEKLNIEISDASGKIVCKQELVNDVIYNQHKVDVSQLDPGIYFGKLYNSASVQNFKFNRQ